MDPVDPTSTPSPKSPPELPPEPAGGRGAFAGWGLSWGGWFDNRRGEWWLLAQLALIAAHLLPPWPAPGSWGYAWPLPIAAVGAVLFLLWSVLHIYVGVAGAVEYFTGDIMSQWTLLIGGANAPVSGFQFPTDALTANAQSHLILNFCLDVGGYGVLGVIVAWMIWARGSWTGYFIGVVAIGIADLSFLFALVTTGIIVANVPTISGPIIWFLAVAITPFGMHPLRRALANAHQDDLEINETSRTGADPQ